MSTIRESIVNIALSYKGQKELKNNSGFQDAKFQKRMEEVGWLKNEPWCCYLAELIWKEAYQNAEINNDVSAELLDKLFSGSATKTFKNFDASKFITRNPKNKTLPNLEPEPGDLVIWRFGNDWTGHAGIVVAVGLDKKSFTTIEGNSNNDGSREGVEVVIKGRRTDKEFSKTGLNLVGFVKPLEL